MAPNGAGYILNDTGSHSRSLSVDIVGSYLAAEALISEMAADLFSLQMTLRELEFLNGNFGTQAQAIDADLTISQSEQRVTIAHLQWLSS